MLCRPTTANRAPRAAVRWRARRLVSMEAKAGSLGRRFPLAIVLGGLGLPTQLGSANAASPRRKAKRVILIQIQNQEEKHTVQ